MGSDQVTHQDVLFLSVRISIAAASLCIGMVAIVFSIVGLTSAIRDVANILKNGK
jgi:hypothetical protein